VSREDRVQTLGAASSAAPPETESTALARGNVAAPVEDWQKPAPSSEVSWEMVVPRMVRPPSKSALAEQVIPQSHRLAPSEDLETTVDEPQAAEPILAGALKGISRMQMIRLAVALAITVVGIAALLMVHRWMPRAKPVTPPQPVSAALKLEAEPQGTGMINIKWNAGSSAVSQAREGRLVIMERDQQPETIALAPEQLKIGHLSYGSTAESVGLRLEVVDRSGAIAKESVSLNTPRAAAAPAGQSGQSAIPAKEQVPAANASNAVNGKAKSDSEQIAKTSAPQSNRTAAREFKPPSSPGKAILDTGERGVETSAILPIPPANVPSVNVIPSAIRLLDPVDRIPAPQVKSATPARPVETLAPSALKPGGDLQAGKLIKKVTPAYPAMAANSRVEGTVRFAAVVGKDGAIRNLKALSGPQLLIQAATEAVKQWVYQPTLLNGQPVEVQTQIEVVFNLNK